MSLESIWFFFWGFLWIMYFMTDGFVLGVGAVSLLAAKQDDERRILLNTVGPVWDGNEVWLITAGAITFGAFPLVYAVLFSSLYTALMLLLFCLIVRGVSFEFRSRIASPRWRSVWDGLIFLSSTAAAVLIGVAFANIFQGMPLNRDHVYQGSFFSLINGYGVAGGIVFLVLFVQHGLAWICAKTEGEIFERARNAAAKLFPVSTAAVLLFWILSGLFTDLFANYRSVPVLLIIPALTVLALILHRRYLAREMFFRAWFASAGMIAGVALFGVVGLFPRLLPSSIDPEFSLTIHNSAAQPLSLTIMLITAAVFVPLVLLYQGFAYHIFKHRITATDLESEEAY